MRHVHMYKLNIHSWHCLYLDDKNLPSVPPLQLSIPADYPDQSPHWEDDGQQYGESSCINCQYAILGCLLKCKPS